MVGIPQKRPRLLKWNLAMRMGPDEQRSKVHTDLVHLVRGKVVTLKQASSFIRKINGNHLTIQQAELLVNYLNPDELRRMMSVMSKGRQAAARKERFYANDLPQLILLAQHRASRDSK